MINCHLQDLNKNIWCLIWLPSAFLYSWLHFCKMLEHLLETSKHILKMNFTLIASVSRCFLWFACLLAIRKAVCPLRWLAAGAEQAQGSATSHRTCVSLLWGWPQLVFTPPVLSINNRPPPSYLTWALTFLLLGWMPLYILMDSFQMQFDWVINNV